MSELVRDETAWLIRQVTHLGSLYDEQREGGARYLKIQSGLEGGCWEAFWTSGLPSEAKCPKGIGHNATSAIAMLLRIIREANK